MRRRRKTLLLALFLLAPIVTPVRESELSRRDRRLAESTRDVPIP